MSSIERLFSTSGRAALGLIAASDVAQRWLEPSALTGYRVGGLACHLGRAVLTVDRYLAGPLPAATATPVDAAGYFAVVLADHDPHGSDFHAAVRQRAEDLVDAGQEELVAAVTQALERFEQAKHDLAQPVAVLDDVVMTVSDYLESRLVELTIHSFDLARSLGRAAPSFEDEVWRTVARVLTDVTLLRTPADRVALALARPSDVPPVGAFENVAG